MNEAPLADGFSRILKFFFAFIPAGFGSTSTSLFGSSQLATSSIFGSSATTAAQPQQSSLFSGGGFGGFSSPASSLGQPQSGTTIKFAAPTGQDTINKNGSQQTINTNHQCITAMKEYKAKSLEELRFEDYQANRKTGQQQQTSAFGASTSSGLFGSSTAAAQPASTGFGGSGTSLFGGSTAQNASRPLLFGGTQATTAAQPATTSLFGQSSTQNKSIFGASSTSTASTGFGGFGASQPTTVIIFYSLFDLKLEIVDLLLVFGSIYSRKKFVSSNLPGPYKNSHLLN